MTCPSCERTNPADARYCIYCSAQLAPNAPEVQAATPATGPTTRLPKESVPGYTMPAPAPATPPLPQSTAPSIPHPASFAPGVIGAIFLIGLGLLFLTRSFFPGILVLVGITSFMGDAMRGRQRRGLSTLIFLTGLALLFWWGNIFPGILILIGIMALLNGRRGFC